MLEKSGCKVVFIDGFRMFICGFIYKVARKCIRVITKTPDFDFKNKISRIKIFGLAKSILGYHAVIIAKKV